MARERAHRFRRIAAGTQALLLGVLTFALLLSPRDGGRARAEAAPPASERRGMVLVRGGTFRPFYADEGRTRVSVGSFWLDEHAVTNAAFLAFVTAHPEWRRSRVARLFADAGYLTHFASDTSLGNAGPNQPVTRVSWFAAKAFCEADGRRLPREGEWEYAARASEHRADGTNDRALRQRVLAWYARPRPDVLPDVRSTYRNVWGAWDMHGLVWEWVEDWNTPRDTDGLDGDQRVCGGASFGAGDSTDYATFMRFSFRSSLRGDYTVANLGFRCAADVE